MDAFLPHNQLHTLLLHFSSFQPVTNFFHLPTYIWPPGFQYFIFIVLKPSFNTGPTFALTVVVLMELY